MSTDFLAGSVSMENRTKIKYKKEHRTGHWPQPRQLRGHLCQGPQLEPTDPGRARDVSRDRRGRCGGLLRRHVRGDLRGRSPVVSCSEGVHRRVCRCSGMGSPVRCRVFVVFFSNGGTGVPREVGKLWERRKVCPLDHCISSIPCEFLISKTTIPDIPPHW